MHNNEEHIEQQLWGYIDGVCDHTEQERIASLIAQGGVWAAKYNELLALHSDLNNVIELEHPPLRFTKNIMETIAATYPVAARKRYVNPGIVKGIAAVFFISIIILLAYSFGTADWRAPETKVSMPHFNFSGLLTTPLINIIIAANVVLGLVLLDLTLRSKRALRH